MIQEQHPNPTPHPFMKAAAQRCAHCRRDLPTGEGTDVPFIGVVGPECVKKYASLRRALEAMNGLQALEWDRGTMTLAWYVIRDLKNIGVAVEVVDVRAGVKEVRIKGVTRKPRAVIESWRQIQAKFEQRLQLAQAEREAQDAGEYLTLTNPVTGSAVVRYGTNGVAL